MRFEDVMVGWFIISLLCIVAWFMLAPLVSSLIAKIRKQQPADDKFCSCISVEEPEYCKKCNKQIEPYDAEAHVNAYPWM